LDGFFRLLRAVHGLKEIWFCHDSVQRRFRYLSGSYTYTSCQEPQLVIEKEDQDLFYVRAGYSVSCFPAAVLSSPRLII
jgi:hypothetical protein